MLTVDDKRAGELFKLFPFLSGEEKEQILLNAKLGSYEKGALVFCEGELPEGLLYLSSGKAKVFKKGILGKEQITRLVQRSQLLGFRALCAGGRYTASAQAIEPSTVCTVGRECFLSLMQANSAFAMAMLRHVSRALGFADLRTVTLTQKHMRARLADSLLMLADAYGMESDSQTLGVNLSRHDLADLSNMTTPNVIRTLSAFQGEGLVNFSRHTIRLLDTRAIGSISRHGWRGGEPSH
jgi:CRP-like cAMP-binding protein